MFLPDSAILYLSDAHGVYIPQGFVELTDPSCIGGVYDEDLDILRAGPEHEHYWETWESVIQNAVLTNQRTGQHYVLHQDGDLWLLPKEYEYIDLPFTMAQDAAELVNRYQYAEFTGGAEEDWDAMHSASRVRREQALLDFCTDNGYRNEWGQTFSLRVEHGEVIATPDA